MAEYIFAEQNNRNIPKEDKIFGINNRAKMMIAEQGKSKVTNATIGSMLDDNGNLVILSSVAEVMKKLQPIDYADYAPIGGVPTFREAIQKAAFRNYTPKSHTIAVSTPGGTGAIRNTISNYSKYGDKVLTTDWFWGPYNTVAQEIGRTIATYEIFDENEKYNVKGLDAKVNELLREQESLVIILNTPAHNPTGYSLTPEDWDGVLDVLKKAVSSGGKKITLLVDVAYIDFAGEADKCREFLPKLDQLPENILPIIAYSTSKTFTFYGMRCGAAICMAGTEAIAAEFKKVFEFSSRGTWSNSTKAPQVVISKIYEDEELLKKVDEERRLYREMLLRRGKAFEEEAEELGLHILPYDSGFFASVPCGDPEPIAARLEEEGIFLVPLAKGLRISIASISEDKCKMLPEKIVAAMK